MAVISFDWCMGLFTWLGVSTRLIRWASQRAKIGPNSHVANDLHTLVLQRFCSDVIRDLQHLAA